MKKVITKYLSICALSLALISGPSLASDVQNKAQHDIVEVAFVLDTTGSMASLIEGAKQKIWSIANTIVDINPNAEIRMALVAYRDKGDAYIVRTHRMSTDIQGLYGKLIGLHAGGGGDTPESVNEALDAAVDQLTWDESQNTRRIIFLVGDAPPHMDYVNAPKYPEVIKQAVSRDITIHAVQAGDSFATRQIWQDIAQRGGGRYIPIPQSGGQISIIETPFDQKIIDLQRQIDQTIVPYGPKAQLDILEQQLEEKASGSISKRVDNYAFYSKRSGRKEIVTGGGDMISAVRNKDVELDDIKTNELPAPMQAMTKKEKQDYVEDIISQRSELEAQMSELVKQRDDYLTRAEAVAPVAETSFDRAVREAL